MQQAYLRTADAAEYIGLSSSLLEKLRCNGGGPVFRRLGQRRVVYAREDLDRWVSENGRTSTADADARRG